MNDDFEKRLRDVRLAAPSRELDRRIESIFASPRRAHRGWWLAALPAAAAVAALLMLIGLRRPSPVPVAPPVPMLVYQVEPSGLMRELLLTPPVRAKAPPNLSVSVRL